MLEVGANGSRYLVHHARFETSLFAWCFVHATFLKPVDKCFDCVIESVTMSRTNHFQRAQAQASIPDNQQARSAHGSLYSCTLWSFHPWGPVQASRSGQMNGLGQRQIEYTGMVLQTVLDFSALMYQTHSHPKDPKGLMASDIDYENVFAVTVHRCTGDVNSMLHGFPGFAAPALFAGGHLRGCLACRGFQCFSVGLFAKASRKSWVGLLNYFHCCDPCTLGVC